MTRTMLTRLILLTLLTALGLAACQPTAASGDTLLADDFTATEGGWLRQTDAEASTDIVDGEFRIQVYVPRLAVFSYVDEDLRDVVIAVEVYSPASAPIDNLMGVVCRRRDDQNYYFMGVSADGYYGIGRVQDGVETLIHRTDANWDQSDAILQNDARNQIEARCVGNTLSLSVNGVLLAETSDSAFNRGSVGLYGRSFREGQVEVRFDNFLVSQP